MKNRRYTTSFAVVLLLGIAAIGMRWLGTLRAAPPELKVANEIVVLSGADSGRGTLREAIFNAARSGKRTRILLRPATIALKTPLPPIIGAPGIVLDGSASKSTIDGAAVPSGALVDVASPNSAIVGVTIANARSRGLQVRAVNVLIQASTFRGCADAVSIAASARAAVVERSRFEGNAIGVRVSADAVGTVIRDNDFSRSDQGSIWVAAPAAIAEANPRVAVQKNRFKGDRVSIAIINTPAVVEENQVQDARETGILLLGSRGIARKNSVTGGVTGIMVDSSVGAVIDGNEVARNSTMGVQIRSSRHTAVEHNRVYSNGYGVVIIFGEQGDPDFIHDNLVTSNTYDGIQLVGSSPLLRGNQILQNRAAGVRILDYIPLTGARVKSEPRLENNVFKENKIDAPVRGEYRQPREKTTK